MAGDLAGDQRLVTVVLSDDTGAVLGALDPILVRPRFWPEVDEVVRQVRERAGVEVLVLRLLTTSGGYAGGEVSYLAQVTSGLPAGRLPAVTPAVGAALASDPSHRQWWAQPGGLAWLESWVDSALASHGRHRTGALRQRKTWNLSVVVTAPTSAGEVWLKAVPPFLADEGGVIARVARVDPELVPQVLGHEPGHRAILMEELGGHDQWGLGGAPGDAGVIRAMVSRWVAVQAALVEDAEHVLALGAADLRRTAFTRAAGDLAGRPDLRSHLGTEQTGRLDTLVEELPDRYAALAECGLPDTLVHADLHPGNWRRDGERLTLLDWGDVAVGSPVVDTRAFVERLEDERLRRWTVDLWAEQWRRHAPGSDPVRALSLVRPLAELAAAVTYQRFLDHVEETERVYHALDPADHVRAALAALAEPTAETSGALT